MNKEKTSGNTNRAQAKKQELEQAEVAYYEASLSFNIMIIHLAYDTIENFKREKQQQF